MKSNSLRLYYALPPSLRSVLASVHGYRLRRHRFGPESEQLIGEAAARETWSADQWKTWQQERLARMLTIAATRVPYYREQWAERRRRGDNASWELLENWPVLEKSEIRAHQGKFLVEGADPSKLRSDTTSGTTGQPIKLHFSTETERGWYALYELRWRRWNKIAAGTRWAMAAAQLVTPLEQRKPPYWVWNAAAQQLYMSAYHLSDETVAQYLAALVRYRIQFLWGHSAVLDSLARAVLATGQPGPRMQVALSTSEPLTASQRRRIEEAFACPVRETYGMAELMAGGSECQAGHLHLWPETGCFEFLNDGKPVRPGETGELISTGLLNHDMPFIRYRTGDLATAPDPQFRCPCGRTLPVVGGIEGRTSDSLVLAGGQRISPSAAEMVFDADLPLEEAQLTQVGLQRFHIRYRPGPGYSPATEAAIRARIAERLGDVQVEFEAVDRIPRGPNGKFRAVVCALSAEEKSRSAAQPATQAG